MMDQVRVRGGRALNGSVQVSGSKNAALPILISALLTEDVCHFSRVPNLQDIRTVLKLLAHMGVEVTSELHRNQVSLRAARVSQLEAPYDLVRTMRASVVVLGPLLARFGQAKVSLPGGCAIGARPINFHLSGLEKLGAQIELENGYVLAKAKKLKGARISFEFPSVGATENLMMACVLAEGESILENCAQEPEICDLADALRAMGAKIEGDGTATIQIQGAQTLRGASHEVMADRIEAGTFLCAAVATGGTVTVQGLNSQYIESLLIKLEESGAVVSRGKEQITVKSQGRPQSVNVSTLPYPGFPTDMQAQFMAVMAVAEGAALITETIFENRFMHVSELARLGADISIRGNTALVRGQAQLRGAPLMATDLRASASLIIGGLCAQGETLIQRIYHLDRGYERMESKLVSLGAEIERLASSV